MKSLKTLIISTIILAILAIGLSVYLAWQGQKSSPTASLVNEAETEAENLVPDEPTPPKIPATIPY